MANRIRVVHLSVGLHVGGLEKLLVEFARHADRSRFDLRFISLTSIGAAGDEIAQMGFPVIAMNERPGIRSGLPMRLARHLRGSNVLHTHNLKPMLYGVAGARLARVGGIVHTRHGQRQGATKRQTLMFSLASKLVDRIVCVSKDAARLCIAHGINANRVETIHNGIDLSRFTYRGPTQNGPAIAVGRLSPEKDIATLLRATALIAKQEPSFRLNIVGTGPIHAELERLSHELGISDRVTFVGETQAVGELLARSSVYVLSSLTEGISLALLEAMAVGIPAVATAVGGNVEVLVDGETGMLVPPQSPQLLADAMLALYRDPRRSLKIAQLARRCVETHFDVLRMVGQYESLYADIASDSANRLAA